MQKPELRTFTHFPPNATCPVCGMSDDDETVLIPIDGTQDGNICEAQPVHLACCIPTNYNRFPGLLYRRTGGEK